MEYYGTSLTEHGHFRWILTDKGMQYVPSRISELPFTPEGLINNVPKGKLIYYQGEGYTVIGISGSPKDTRPGSKSIFWEHELLSKKEMIERIKSNKYAMIIIEAMPFAAL